jgi:hypothetical protein
MSKTPYEIRLELLKMAQDQVTQRYYQKMDNLRYNSSIKNDPLPLNEVPQFPSPQEILLEAEVLKTFVDKQ